MTREEKLKAFEAEKAAQAEVDEAAFEKLEDEHGFGALYKLPAPRYVSGVETFAVMRAPSGDEYKRYTTQVRGAKGDGATVGKAQDLLARSCWVYPESKEARDRFVDTFGGTLPSITMMAIKLSDLKAEEEGKG